MSDPRYNDPIVLNTEHGMLPPILSPIAFTLQAPDPPDPSDVRATCAVCGGEAPWGIGRTCEDPECIELMRQAAAKRKALAEASRAQAKKRFRQRLKYDRRYRET